MAQARKVKLNRSMSLTEMQSIHMHDVLVIHLDGFKHSDG